MVNASASWYRSRIHEPLNPDAPGLRRLHPHLRRKAAGAHLALPDVQLRVSLPLADTGLTRVNGV